MNEPDRWPGFDHLLVLDDQGQVAESFTNRTIAGPCDMAVRAEPTTASLFVANALGGDTRTSHGVPVAGSCTVVRLDLALKPDGPPTLTASTVIGRGFRWRANTAALVLAPTGVALAGNGTLYVDNSLTDIVSSIPHALTRTDAVTGSATTVASGDHLKAPLGMTVSPTGTW